MTHTALGFPPREKVECKHPAASPAELHFRLEHPKSVSIQLHAAGSGGRHSTGRYWSN